MCECISCGARKHWREMHAGHFIHNKNTNFFDEGNVNAQCAGCNTFKHGNLHYYLKALEFKIGKKAVNKLMQQKFQIKKNPTQEELDKLSKYYEEQFKIISKHKNLD